MPDVYLLFSVSLPDSLSGSFLNHSILKLPSDYYVSIEDRLFEDTSEQITIPSSDTTAIRFKNTNMQSEQLDEYARLVEFSLSLASTSYIPAYASAVFSGNTCKYVKLYRPYYLHIVPEVKFPAKLTGQGLAQWIVTCVKSQKNLGSRMHVTIDRYLRYVKSTSDPDGLLDLCISLESLIDVQTEISFRFSTCLAKITGERGESAAALADLLSELYSVRSSIVHGNPKAVDQSKKLSQKNEELAALVVM